MASFDYDRFIAIVMKEQVSPLDPEELELLKKVVMHPAVLKLLGYVRAVLMKTGNSFTSIELGTGAGVAAAIKLQGNLDGYSRFVEILGQVVAGSSIEEEFENV